MKPSKHFLICLSILTSLCFQTLYSQVTNGNRYNVQAQATRYYFGPDSQNGTNYPTFLLHADMDTDGANTKLINDDGTPYEYSVIKNADTPEDWSFTKTILGETNETSQYMDFTFYAFDNFCGDRYVVNNCCGFLCTGTNDYEDAKVWWSRRSLTSGEPGQWYNSSLGDGNHKVYYRTTWRYTHGRWNSPLAFGTLADGSTKTHTNYNRTIASGATGTSSIYGYRNDWPTSNWPTATNGPDVTYSFTVSEPSQLSIGTFSSSFDTRIHLASNTSPFVVLATDSDSNSGTNSLINYAVEPGNYLIIVEGDNGESGKFNVYVTSNEGELTAGTISHPAPWVKEGCTLTIPISTNEAPVSSLGAIEYFWEKRVDGGNWENISGANTEELTGAQLGMLSEDTEFQRTAVVGNVKRTSNIFEIKVVPLSGFASDGIRADGLITGKVTGKNGIGNVPGVTVYAVADPTVHGECEGKIYSAVTGPNGNYEISGIYYGRNEDSTSIVNTQYRVYPEFANHIFEPSEIYVANMWSLSNNKENVDFEDVTTLFARGTITQNDGTTICPVEGVQFYVDNLLNIETSNELGDYEIAFEFQGEYDIRPQYLDHQFSPAMTTVDVMETDVDGIHFEDTETHIIEGHVWSCGMDEFGKFELAVEDTLGCFLYTVETDLNGYYNMSVPARAYYVSITDVIDGTLDPGYVEGVIMNFFNESVLVDATIDDVVQNFIYRQEPVIEIEGLTANGCGDYVLAQGENTWINIDVSELNTDGCPLDTGTLIIIDNVSDLAQTEVPISNGQVQYEIQPGEPTLTDGFVKTLSLTAKHIDRSELTTTEVIEIVVTGAKSREATFTTVSPQIPFIILRDPPGDGSYAYLSESQTSEMVMSLSTLIGGSVSTWSNVNTGAQFEAGFLGFSTETEIWGELENSVTMGAYNRNQFELGLELTNGSEFRTSDLDDPNVMGSGGDLYVGAALSLRYAKADVVSYNESECGGQVTVELIMGDANTETQFAYTEYSILNSIIPSLESIRDLQSSQADIDYYQNQINVWNQTVEQNNNLKSIATPSSAYPDNISWSGGGASQEYFTTTSVSSNITIEFQAEVESSIATDIGMEVAGSGVSGGVTTTFRMELGAGSSTSNSSTRTTGFVLVDDDALDRYETGVKLCPVYNTPVFDDIAAVTSCPYQTGTSPIDSPVLSVTPSIQTNINPTSSAEFVIRVTNLSQDEKTRSYFLNIVDGTNPHSANIDPGGDGIFPIEFSNLSYGEFNERSIFISKQTSSEIYSYEGIEFIAYPAACDDSGEYVTDQKSLSVYFDATCSDITMQEPQSGWIANDDANNSLGIHLKDYDVTNLNQVIIQYTETGLNSWLTAVLLDPIDLNSNSSVGTFTDWNLINIADGTYDLRTKLNCTGATIYTPRVSGIVDRIGPIVMGIPYPLDDTYEDGVDEISVRYTESINCSQVMASLTNIDTGVSISSTVGCANNMLELVPDPLLGTLGPAAYRVSISGVKDNYGNISEPYSWVFIVGNYEYDPDCSPLTISNNNINQNSISQSTYSATQITSYGSVANATVITFKAEEEIDLLPGFQVDPGAQFVAEIEDCEE